MENSGIKIIGSLVDIYTTRNYGLPLSGITDYRYMWYINLPFSITTPISVIP